MSSPPTRDTSMDSASSIPADPLEQQRLALAAQMDAMKKKQEKLDREIEAQRQEAARKKKEEEDAAARKKKEEEDAAARQKAADEEKKKAAEDRRKARAAAKQKEDDDLAARNASVDTWRVEASRSEYRENSRELAGAVSPDCPHKVKAEVVVPPKTK